MARLAGGVEFITGGGIGRATAERFAEEGEDPSLGLGLPEPHGYLASDQSVITTGQILSVDSGAPII